MTRLLACFLSISLPVYASQSIQVETVASDLDFPWSLAFLPEGGYLVTERTGSLVSFSAAGELLSRHSVALPKIFVAAQGGLLDIKLAKDFSQSGRLFLSYSCGNIHANSTCLASAQWAAGELTAIRPIFHAKPDRQGAAHYGGRIALLPDNSLLLTLGDGFDFREQAQNKASHIGKIVRLTEDGAAPTDNPFVEQPGVAAEIFTLGHRNVQGIFYDEVTNKIYSHEHGPKGGDELNLLEAGKNYGWPVATYGVDYTGARISPFTEFAGMQAPLHVWTPSIAPAGMTLYRGELFPKWHGNIFVSALAGKALHRLVLENDKVVTEEVLLKELGSRIRDVRTGPDGAIYLLTDGANGQLLRLTP
ncbi:glucose dehydrogenase [Alishewanella longhuensis]|uniref:Glucose dehydrogenase n=1 Tax=Alishewanella longhuensis TaxID=1091037 RepID=A0ABQ3KYJ8_9ALTE|nr:PQQ-dependent sugar dehydrogenase [Alishewanella longhuensis]GHG70224.1 glucose dehydrogenase [Alishewanella longhuensis]